MSVLLLPSKTVPVVIVERRVRERGILLLYYFRGSEFNACFRPLFGGYFVNNNKPGETSFPTRVRNRVLHLLDRIRAIFLFSIISVRFLLRRVSAPFTDTSFEIIHTFHIKEKFIQTEIFVGIQCVSF